MFGIDDMERINEEREKRLRELQERREAQKDRKEPNATDVRPVQ